MALSTDQKIDALKNAELFSIMPADELPYVAEIAQEVTLHAGEQFIQQGATGDCLYLIVSGEAEVALNDMGRIAQRGAASLVGELAIMWRQPRSANCSAITDMTLLKISRDDFWLLMEKHPSLVRGAINVLMKRLDERSEDLKQLGGSALG